MGIITKVHSQPMLMTLKDLKNSLKWEIHYVLKYIDAFFLRKIKENSD